MPALAPPTGQPAFPQKGQAALIEKSPANPINQPENLSPWPRSLVASAGFFLWEQQSGESQHSVERWFEEILIKGTVQVKFYL
jgi:hypothetical protein